MRYLIIILIYLIGASSCVKHWSEEESKEFINDCLVVQGVEEVCLCVLDCLEKEYDNYKTVLINVPKSELGGGVEKCLQKCKQ